VSQVRAGRLEVRDLVLIALLAAIGGVLSTYVGYIGNLINRLFGVPFGAGQLIAGLHVLWPILARLVIIRFGAGTLTGTLKGAVEFFSGGTHGVIVVLVSLVEGLLVDLGMGVSRRRSFAWTLAAGAAASASNVFVFQAVYFSGVPLHYVGMMAGLAGLSGAALGGFLAWDLERAMVDARILRRASHSETPTRRRGWARAVSLAIVLAFLGGGVHFYLNIFDPFFDPETARIEGLVESPYRFEYRSADDRAVSVVAELRGSVTYVPATEYTGIPLGEVIGAAVPEPEATRVRVVAGDGYEARFSLDDVLADRSILLAGDRDGLRLIAPGRDGSEWVRGVVRVVIE